MMKRLIAAAMLTAILHPAHAETVPRPMKVDSRSTTALYQEGQVYKIYTRLKRVTLIKLADGERFIDFKAGDTESFMFSDTENGNAILVKPVVGGADTNGIIITNRRFYIVELHETSKRRPHYAVNFVAPKSSSQPKGFTGATTRLPKQYEVSKSSKKGEIRLVRVWDDGQKTHFEFGPDAPIPSVYRADDAGREYIVNARTQGQTVTVGRRSSRWVIRYGDDYVCVQERMLTDG